MNLAETQSLIAALRQAGATHFKSADFEVSFCSSFAEKLNEKPVSTFPPDLEPKSAGDIPAENPEATEKLKDQIATLQMKDEELLDKVFPV